MVERASQPIQLLHFQRAVPGQAMDCKLCMRLCQAACRQMLLLCRIAGLMPGQYGAGPWPSPDSNSQRRRPHQLSRDRMRSGCRSAMFELARQESMLDESRSSNRH